MPRREHTSGQNRVVDERFVESARLAAEASVAAASRLVADAYAGVVLLLDRGEVAPLPGLPGDVLLTANSPLIETVRSRLIVGEMHFACLCPSQEKPAAPGHVRVTFLAHPDASHGLRGLVLLSPAGAGHGLTPRELEVLGGMVDGCSNAQIADQLAVTLRTVATHVEHILAKLASPTRTHAAVHAHREGLYVPAPRRAGER